MTKGLLPRVSPHPLLFQGYHRSNHFIATQGTCHLCPRAPVCPECAECPLPPFCLPSELLDSLSVSLLSVSVCLSLTLAGSSGVRLPVSVPPGVCVSQCAQCVCSSLSICLSPGWYLQRG